MAVTDADEVLYFEQAKAWRAWLRSNHRRAECCWVGYFKKATGKPTMTWSESVDHALCFGWIDGIRKRVDDERYRIRFTPRRAGSIWSAVNIEKVAELDRKGLMCVAGHAAFDKRMVERSKLYAYERENAQLSQSHLDQLRAEPEAWEAWERLAPSMKRKLSHWVVSAKREATRQRRFGKLLEAAQRDELNQ